MLGVTRIGMLVGAFCYADDVAIVSHKISIACDARHMYSFCWFI